MALRIVLLFLSYFPIVSGQTSCAERAKSADIVDLCPFSNADSGIDCCEGKQVRLPDTKEIVDCPVAIDIFEGNGSVNYTREDCDVLRFIIEIRHGNLCPCDSSLTSSPDSVAPFTSAPIIPVEDNSAEPSATPGPPAMCYDRPTIIDFFEATGISGFRDTACWVNLYDFDLVQLPDDSAVPCNEAYDKYIFENDEAKQWSDDDCRLVQSEMRDNCRCMPTLPPDDEGGNSWGGLCFSGSSTVTVQNRGRMSIRELQIGDMVLTSDQKYEPIYSFGHRIENAEGDFVRITTADKNSLEMSSKHMIFTKDRGVIPASMLRKDDHVLNSLGVEVVVQSIAMIASKGLYAPFTPSGQLVVNDIIVSSFVAFETDSSMLEVGGMIPSFSYQWLAHTFEFPHRVACHYHLVKCPNETYTSNGISQWVARPFVLSEWLLNQQSSLLKTIALVAFIAVLFVFNILETIILMDVQVLGFLLVGLLPLLLLRRTGAKYIKMV
mmetsp:Transcript_14394/g.21239  ORF Transcript_14394/g.21239 Transcript_14394/m.21239 type:complete len:493 (-) Transcript_14394:256-1734(-)|eukprot:CAMPEP_0194222416 /NCGR_PEP_ID=MMETSP0156-20130528/32891_1 /TAXON_ID=33649 /ORGANISM="Thalassionema nitzschioides, Strain L26-B" /LENGTH=492 /DNA_ID=CAMNT_0038953195 /DNA_START=71 /DNA_END=1549 /DNA_ORIENTATION=-